MYICSEILRMTLCLSNYLRNLTKQIIRNHLKKMKTTRIIIAFFLMLFAVEANAQDSYRETLKAYMKVNPNLQSFTSDNMKTAFQGINSILLSDTDADEAEKLTTRYIDEQLWEDLTDMLMPSMKENLTESDLKELTVILSTPEALSYTTHNMEWTSAISESMTETITEAVKAIAADKTPSPIKLASNIDKQYVEKFTKLAEESEVMSQFKKGFELGGDQLPEALTTWMNDNMINMMVNSSYGIFTDKDIDFGINLSKMPVYKKTINATNSLLNNPMEIGLSLITNYQNWLKKQGVEVEDLPF